MKSPSLFSTVAAKTREALISAGKAWKKILIVVLILAAIVALQKYLPVQAWLRDGTHTYRDLGLRGMLLFIATYVVLSLLFVPGPTLSLTAGLIYGFGKGYLLTAAGGVIAAAVAWLLAHTLLRKKARQWASQYSSFQAVDAATVKYGWRIAPVVHMSPIFPVTVANSLLSLTSLRFPGYLIGNWLGMAPGIMFYVFVGTLGDHLALKSAHLSAANWWILGAGRVGLWITGFGSTALLALIVRRFSRHAPAAGSEAA